MPSQLPRTRVQLAPELAAHVDLMAVRTGISFSQLCQFALGMLGHVEMRELLKSEPEDARPEARWLRLKPMHKDALVLFSSDHRVSRSRCLGVALAELVRRYHAQGSPVFPGTLAGALSADASA